MAQLSQLLPNTTIIPEVRMSTMGYMLWISWQKRLPSAINQTLENYGGMQVYVQEEQSQAIWFFFTDDVFLVLARLIIWGHFNELPVSVEVFPGRLQIDRKGEISLQIDASLTSQEVVVPDKLEVWVHSKCCENHKVMPGIEFTEKRARQGMAPVTWMTPTVDMRMPFSSTQSWLIILHPLGSPLDKAFIDGWYAMYKRLTELFQQHKIKSIYENYFIVLAIENLLMLRGFMRDYLLLVKEMDASQTSWPCVIAIADRANLNFSGDVPQKVNLHWARLVAGFPYISYRNAYLLGKGFLVRDLHFSGDQMTMDEWCNIQLVDQDSRRETISLLMPGKLTETVEGSSECFFCGLSSHKSIDCPTLQMPFQDEDKWDLIGRLDFFGMKQAFQDIEKNLEKKGLEGFRAIEKQDNKTTILLDCILDILKYCQFRNFEHFWLFRMKEPDFEDRKIERDGSLAWDYLDELLKGNVGDFPNIFKQVNELIDEQHRDPRLHTLGGFGAVCRNDYEAAVKAFSRAAVLNSNVPLEAWNEFLVARVREVQGLYSDAIQLYKKVSHIMADPLESRYRAIVCRVKMGFAEQIQEEILGVIRENPQYFNRFLIDPGLDRGRILVLSTLHTLWKQAEESATHEQAKIRTMRIKFDEWFNSDHPFRRNFDTKLIALERIANIKNYISFLHLLEQRPELEEELEMSIDQEVENLRQEYKAYLNNLQVIRDEFSWFPFPSALKEFGQEFNEAAKVLNWAYSNNFRDVGIFRMAQGRTDEIRKLLSKLKKRLNSLRFVRDSTLFAVTMGRTFFVAEIIGLFLCLSFVIVVGFFGDTLHLGWLKALISANKVSILEVLVIVISVMALGISALRTTIIFDSRKDKLMEKARVSREQDSEQKLQRAKQDQREKLEAAKRLEEEEKQAEMRRNLRERLGN